MPEGRKKLRDLLQRAQRVGLKPTQIWTSPYLRCVQTAEEVQKIFQLPITQKHQLAPGQDPTSLRWKDGLWIVGHEPDLSQLAAHLFKTRITFKKAALAGFLNGQLEFLITPKWTKPEPNSP